MDNRTENVDQLFEELRRTPAMSVAELESMVARRGSQRKSRPVIVWGGSAVLAILIGAGFFLTQGNPATVVPPGTGIAAAPVIASTGNSPAHAAIAPQTSSTRATESHRMQLNHGSQSGGIRFSAMNNVRHHEKGAVARIEPKPETPQSPTSASSENVQTMTFGGSKLVELTKEELAAIGVRVTEDGGVESNYQFFKGHTSSTDSSVRQVTTWRGVITDSTYEHIQFSPINEELKLSYPTFYPSHVTDLQGRRREFRWRGDLYAESPWTYEFMLQVSRTKDSGDARQFRNPLYITRLIPIRVRTGNEQRDVILWYHPQTSVLAALPHRVQVQLRDEVESIEAGIPSSDTALATYRTWISCTRYELDSILAATRPTATLNIDKEDPAATGSCYLSFCTISSGGINSAPIFPNPAHDAVTVGYRLLGRRMVTITLHDINGAQVRQLVAPHQNEAGRWEMRGSLAGVKPGIYLVVISTEKGEQVVQRVIVE